MRTLQKFNTAAITICIVLQHDISLLYTFKESMMAILYVNLSCNEETILRFNEIILMIMYVFFIIVSKCFEWKGVECKLWVPNTK